VRRRGAGLLATGRGQASGRTDPPVPQPETPLLAWLAAAAIALWFLATLFLSLLPVSDADMGFHIAWGRVLLADFGGARTLTLGQHPSIVVYAYSYWLYQVAAATLYGAFGSWGLVVLRAALVLGALVLAFLLAGRLGAPLWARALLLAFGVLVGQERFVDRPDLFSTFAWIAALWILMRHRHGRGVWALVPLQIVWANTHLFFSLLPAAYVAFAAGDFIDGRRELRRAVFVLAMLVAASCIGPAGPGAWSSLRLLAGFATDRAVPVQIEELVGSYANYKNFLSVWVYRLGMPLCVLAAVAARRRLGTGAVLALLIPAILSILARRTMTLFAMSAVALVPPALEAISARLPRRAMRPARLAAVAASLTAALVVVAGLANGRLLLAQDRVGRVAQIGDPYFPGLGAARFLRDASVGGPIFHNPIVAPAILLENGMRLTPFLDARWLGTDEAFAVYGRLVRADDAAVGAAWREAERAHGFEAVILDFYEMPALLRHVHGDPAWATVFADETAAVFCRRAGPNARAIEAHEARVAAARSLPDPERESALGREVLRVLESAKPSPLAALDFPWESFRRGNFALQVRDRDGAQTAYLDLFRRERGSLSVSPHREDIVKNTLWCLGESGEWEARAGLASALLEEGAPDPKSRLSLRIERVRAMLALERMSELEREALALAADPAAGPDNRWWAWTSVARAREATGRAAAALEALRAASRERPDAAETHRAIGLMLDLRLSRGPEALPEYDTFLRLGGADPWVEKRVHELRGAVP